MRRDDVDAVLEGLVKFLKCKRVKGTNKTETTEREAKCRKRIAFDDQDSENSLN